MLASIGEMIAWLRDFRFRRQSMRWTRKELEAQQSRRFRTLVQFVARHSPYYAQLFADHRLNPDTVQLEEIPPLNKQMMIENFDRIVTNPTLTTARISEFLSSNNDPTQLLDGRYYVIRTSGTSGAPTSTAYSVREWIRGCSLQMRQTPGLQWRRRIAFVGATNGHFAGISLALTGRRGVNRLFFNSKGFDHNLPIDSLVAGLNQFQPQVLTGYANLHAALVQQAIRGRLQIRPKYVVSSGEPLSPEMRSLLERTYKATVIDLYCSSETLLVAGGASADGMMLYEEDNCFELSSDCWLSTNLFNRTVPLIRYQIKDVLEPCDSLQADAPFRWIKKVVGRSEQAFELLNNDGDLEPVGPMSILYVPIPSVPGMQLVINDPGCIEFRILVPPQMSMFEEAAMLRDTRVGIQNWLAGKRMDRGVRFRVVGVSQLENDPASGKAKVIIRAANATRRSA